MRYIVTGATGFIGSHLINELVSSHAKVYALKKANSYPRISLAQHPLWIEGTLDDLQEEHMQSADCLIHLAAHGVNPAVANWQECFYWNVTASLNVWMRAVKAGIKNFIICGSCSEYGTIGEKYDYIPVDAPLYPTGPYHASKAAATMAASGFSQKEQVKVWVLRPFQVWGEGEAQNRLYPQIINAIENNTDLNLTPGMQIRDFIYVKEIAKLIHGYSILLNEKKNGFFKISNLGTGKPKLLRDFVTALWDQHKGQGKLHFGNLPYRENEVMRYVPEIDINEQEIVNKILGNRL